MKNYISIAFIILSSFLLNGCGVYSFTGGSLGPETQSVSIFYFENYAAQAPPTLSQTFTESLKDRFMNQTSLDLLKEDGDLHFEGAITTFSVKPIAIKSTDIAAYNRLTITVKVKFVNSNNEEENFEKSLSKYADYSSDQDISSVEDDLIEEINDQLI